MKSPWCLIHEIAINPGGNQEEHILSCLRGMKWVVTIKLNPMLEMYLYSDSAI